jgi:hypothetical protein
VALGLPFAEDIFPRVSIKAHRCLQQGKLAGGPSPRGAAGHLRRCRGPPRCCNHKLDCEWEVERGVAFA